MKFAETVLAACLVLGCSAVTASRAFAQADTLSFVPVELDSLDDADDPEPVREEDEWLRPPFGEGLLTDPVEWRSSRDDAMEYRLLLDYNRVDNLRYGIRWQFQQSEPMNPRLGVRLEGTSEGGRFLYGVQLEQPIIPPGRIALGVTMVRTTDRSELQQVEDFENTLAFLFVREDYRDYFEREGIGAYLSWRVPDFSTVSVHVRNDDYRTLPLDTGTRSWFNRDRDLRPNPAIDDGGANGLVLRLERLAHRTHLTRAGLYHWIDLEHMGGSFGGDFDYTRLLADVRSVIRLSPATTLSLRGVTGYTGAGDLPAQKVFTLGGVDGLRAHDLLSMRGDQLLLGQAEYAVSLWQFGGSMFESGLHALAFVDAGTTWFSPNHSWNLGDQRFEADGGFGISSSDNRMRLYFARDLQDLDSPFVISLRLQRPF